MRLISVFLLLVGLIASTQAWGWGKETRAESIKLTVHEGSSAWWFALAVSDPATTKVELKDSGATGWTGLTNSGWGYWTLQTSGAALVAPLSIRVTGGSTLTFNNIIANFAPNAVYDTKSSYSSGTGTATSAPTNAPTAKPTSAPTSAPTSSPTNAPTAKPTTAPTAAPTSSPTTAPSANGITVQLNGGSSQWWFAVVVGGGSVAPTSVEIKDSGSYTSYTALQSTNWGAFVFSPSSGVVLPASLRVTSAAGTVELPNVLTSWTNTAVVNTGKTYGGGSTPTSSPTATPTKGATSAPTPAATSAPTPAPTPAATATPTKGATSAPTPAATSAPTPAATSAPTPAPSSGSGSSPSDNPFAGTSYYINPHYTAEVDSSIADYPALASKMQKVRQISSFYWLDRISVIPNLTVIMNQAVAQQASSGKTVLVPIVIYDLPNRDCAAAASNGELQCNGDPNCVSALNQYQHTYIDGIVAVLKNYPNQKIAAIIEPDSLPNLATNLAVPKCAASQYAYIQGTSYAIKQLSTLSNVYMYIDAAHGGWLGWNAGLTATVSVFSQVLTLAGGASKIRGFATNVANYQPLGSLTDAADPCKLSTQGNPASNEVKYIQTLNTALVAAGITGKHFITDTGRNGVPDARSDCSNWCNIKKAGLGLAPTSDTASSGLTNIDAYFWLKPPGESDGTSDTQAQRYDYHCGSSDSWIPSPQAGAWNSAHFASMVSNANPAL